MQWFSAVLQNSLLCVAAVGNGGNLPCSCAQWRGDSAFIVLDLLLYSAAHWNLPVGEKKANWFLKRKIKNTSSKQKHFEGEFHSGSSTSRKQALIIFTGYLWKQATGSVCLDQSLPSHD